MGRVMLSSVSWTTAVAGTPCRLRCRVCAEPVTLVGKTAHLTPELSKAVHTATESETGPDGHLAAPVDFRLAEHRHAETRA